MKKLMALFIFLTAAQAQASTVYLSPGESYRTGRDVVVCGGGAPAQPDVKWWCTCFNSNGKNLGQVWGIWAPDDQQSAEREGKHRCRREKTADYTASVMCNKQNF
jgi:hypothetical protein